MATIALLDVRPIVRLLRALGDETRMRIVALLSHGELCVCHLEDALELSQPNASRHLGILRAAGVMETRREKNWVYYRLASQADVMRKKVLAELTRTFAKKAMLARDVERLKRVKGPTSCV